MCAGQAGQRARVPGPAAPSGPRPGRPLPLAPAGAKALPKGGPLGPGAAPPAPPRSGGLRSNRDSLELSNDGKAADTRPVKGPVPGGLDGAKRGDEQTLVLGDAHGGDASPGVRFHAFEALRLPASFRRALSRFHTRVAEKGGEGSLGGQARAGAGTKVDTLSSGRPLTKPLAATRHASNPGSPESPSASPASDSAAVSARLRFLKRLEGGVGTEGRPLVTTTLSEAAEFAPKELTSEALRKPVAEDAVFTLLRAQLVLLASFEGEEIWQAVAPGKEIYSCEKTTYHVFIRDEGRLSRGRLGSASHQTSHFIWHAFGPQRTVQGLDKRAFPDICSLNSMPSLFAIVSTLLYLSDHAGNSHVARHRNRCLRAVLSGLHPPNADHSSTKTPPNRVLSSNPRNNTFQTELGRGHEPSIERRDALGGRHEAYGPSNGQSWLPPICWTAVGELLCHPKGRSSIF